MDQHILKLFVSEIVRQAENTNYLGSQLNTALKGLPGTISDVFFLLENLLNCSAKVSLLLWPDARGDQSRGKELRERLGIADDSPLKTRAARNHLQHFDERLDKWAAATKDGNYIDNNLGPRANFPKDKPVLRHFDPFAGIFTFGDEAFDIGLLVREVGKVRMAASAFLL